MGLFDKVVNLATGGILDKVVDRVLPHKMDQETRLKLNQEFEKEMVSNQTSLILAEAQSSDPFVSRARPTFLYIIYAVILWNYIVLPLLLMIAKISGVTAFTSFQPLIVPESLWQLFGVGYLGYTGARSWDKKNGVK